MLPPLERALTHAARLARLDEYYDRPILPELRAVLEPRWPCASESFVVANGASDALWSTLQSISVPGDRIAVESPSQPQLLTLMTDLGLELVEVAVDERGPVPGSLREALKTRPVAFFYQPQAQVPTGATLRPRRAAELADLLVRWPGTTVVEYDDLNVLAADPLPSLGHRLPGRTVVIRSYEKSYGPDLRLAVVGGPQSVIEGIHAQIRLTRQWTSRILQATLAWLLADPGTTQLLADARDTYRGRLRALADALAERGVVTHASEGFCLWVPVADERAAVERLAAHGVLVFPGSGCYPHHARAHIRIATSRLDGDYEELADIVRHARQTL
ncbi:PLP-dependent aminotransferase family protein [Streptomyces paludis]|uniref:PLP-dependent aminotransferase family protein n=2 Tax=Streptomyces paludis TaxID=2282738 RepID=A0A345HZX4_9ACTN|nr:PLP-dependent aminotransferase family protein [Streptomyces paludis]